jgi:MFS family permease
MERYYMHTHYMGLAGPALRTAIGIVAGLCFVAFGYGQGDIGGLMIEDSFNSFFPQFAVALAPHSYHVALLSGVVVSTWNIGCFVGAFLTIFLGDRLGRKGTIILGLTMETIGKLIQVSSFSLAQYIAGRVVAGVGNG